MENVIEIININDSIVFRDNDIYAVQNRINALEAMLNTLGEAFVVSGCAVSGTAPNNAVSAGIVFLNGKLHTLPAVATIDLSTAQHIKFLSSTDADPRALSGGGTQNRIKTYLAQISPGIISQSIAISQATPARTFADVIAKDSDLTDLLDTISVRVNTDLTYNTGWANVFPGVPVKYNKNFFGMVQVAGYAQYNGGGTVSIATLPVGYRPSTVKQFNVAGYDASNNPIVGVVEVEATGNMELITPTLASNQKFYLDNVQFYTDM